jgi:hypothetical protein
MEKQGWDVKTMQRNRADKEKGLDIEIALDMNDLSRDVPPATMVLIAGDGDYQTLIPRLQQRGWEVEVAFYGISPGVGAARQLACSVGGALKPKDLNWLPERYAKTNSRMENSVGWGFSVC